MPAHLLELRHLSNRISGCYQKFPYRRTNFCTLGHNDNFITALHYLNYLFIYNVVSTFTKASISLFFSPSINHVLKCYVNPVFIPLIINVYITGIWHRIGHIHFNNCRNGTASPTTKHSPAESVGRISTSVALLSGIRFFIQF